MELIRPRWKPGSLSGELAAAEAIAARDLNNLYRTSCYFADRERYSAFCALYAVMRLVDDRIDAIPARAALSQAERATEHAVVDAWKSAVAACFDAREPAAELLDATECDQAARLLGPFREAIARFPVPQQLWSNFFTAMHRDLERSRFKTYEEFLAYAEGATVAPTTIYLYLLASSDRCREGVFRLPDDFDLMAAGRALGVFAYLGHILRDLAQDLDTGSEGLLYLAADDMAHHGVTEAMLFEDLRRGRASGPVRELAGTLIGRSREALTEGRQLIAVLQGHLSCDRAFILDLIIAIYEAVLEKIEACEGDTFAGRHRLSGADKAALVARVAARASLR
jgi:phytoene synthase